VRRAAKQAVLDCAYSKHLARPQLAHASSVSGLGNRSRSLRSQDWTTDPFKLLSKDGYLYGRGASDNKGPILAMLFAVKELLDQREGFAHGGLPANLAFVFEGEEEVRSWSSCVPVHVSTEAGAPHAHVPGRVVGSAVEIASVCPDKACAHDFILASAANNTCVCARRSAATASRPSCVSTSTGSRSRSSSSSPTRSGLTTTSRASRTACAA
jgi:Peptidase family M20/M25/M40